MIRLNVIIGMFIGVIILFSNAIISESLLWDLLIDAKISSPMNLNEKPIVFGTVVDHAGKPVSEAEVKIRLATQSDSTTTNENGGFLLEFDEITEPGYYVAHVIATSSEDKMGISKINFHVKGDISVSSQTENELDVFVSEYYKNYNFPGDKTDSIELKIFQHYQELEAKLSEQQKKENELAQYQEFLVRQREAALKLEQEKIEELRPGAGTFSGWNYDQFVDNLDESVREIIVNQLNYTINVFSEAQIAMEEVLENGGSMEEARKAYFKKAAVPRDLMESFTSLDDSESEAVSYEDDIVSQSNIIEEKTSELPHIENFQDIKTDNTTVIELGENVTSVILNVNGMEIELVINGTEISQVAKSNQN